MFVFKNTKRLTLSYQSQPRSACSACLRKLLRTTCAWSFVIELFRRVNDWGRLGCCDWLLDVPTSPQNVLPLANETVAHAMEEPWLEVDESDMLLADKLKTKIGVLNKIYLEKSLLHHKVMWTSSHISSSNQQYQLVYLVWHVFKYCGSDQSSNSQKRTKSRRHVQQSRY